MNTYTQTIVEIGNFSLCRNYTTISQSWNHPMGGRFDKPQEKFYYDGVSLELESKTIEFFVSQRKPGYGEIIYTFTKIKKFESSRGVEAVEFFRNCVNGEA